MAGFGQTFNQLVQQQQTQAPAATTGQGINEDWFSQFGGTTATGGTGQIVPIPGQGTPSAPGTVITQNPGANSGGAPGGDPQIYFNSLFPGDTLTPQMLMAQKDALAAHGIQLVPNAAGVPGKIKLPDGSIVDVIEGAGAGVNKKQWLGPGSGSPGGAGQSGGFGGMTFNSPYQNFTAPSLEDARNSPGYQFAQQQGMDAIQHSAAAKGTLLTGGTLKALQSYGTGLADQTYGNVFNRAFQTNQANFNNGLSSDQFNTGTLLNIASMGKPQ